MIKEIDLTRMSAHFQIERKNRMTAIENSVGWGVPVAITEDNHNTNTTATLTSTGVMVIRAEDNTILTAWVANVRQAVAVWMRAYNGEKMPRNLWNIINYNNNTNYWKNLVAA